MEIREAKQTDLPQILSVYKHAISQISSKQLTEQQLNVWALGANNTKKWTTRIEKDYFIIAEQANHIVGFAYFTQGNMLAGLYVQQSHKRQGIGAKLLRVMESRAISQGYNQIKANIVPSALPFFDDYFYEVEKKYRKHLKGVAFDMLGIYKNL
ncbi:GNAT family N-acetyltransferase [Bizionia sediminis]|uniref:GNAT family N-acetyltransferase n=1 Tax=Bizionia sediminis TaxID=1737064 RepID=A0ABW5KTZ0_9FLAO